VTGAALPRDGLVERLRRGEIGSAPLTGAYLERIERHDAELRSFVTVCAGTALDAARAADAALERGEPPRPLHGLPVAVKDNVDTAGVRTTVGSRFFAANVPERDAEVARRLREAGAVLLGKTQLHEFAFGATTQNPHHGACANPWDRSRIPGGSSGGSGAALAADLCALALGTDTGGSVRIPAALDGVSGIRPTLGGVSVRGVFPVAWSLDTVGPMARSVDDVARAFAVLAGHDPEDPVSVDRPADDVLPGLGLGAAGVRVGVPGSFYRAEVEPEVARAVDAAVGTLAALGAQVEEVDLPGAEDALEAANTVVRAEALAIHRERLEAAPDEYGEDVRRRLALGAGGRGTDYAAARQTGRIWRRTVESAFRRVDVVVSPATAIVAPIAAAADMIETTLRLIRFTQGWSLAGVPVLALPCGFSADGLPIGLQLAARWWDERTLFRLGAAYQSATDWHLRAPALDP
jgi:aspartyl-tRNA(Asn)/glutamyl-tRNA(Gln) amidotransferase subunit A